MVREKLESIDSILLVKNFFIIIDFLEDSSWLIDFEATRYIILNKKLFIDL